MNDEELVLSKDEASKSALIARYVPLVKSRAASMKTRYIDADDLVSEGFLGLLNAIRSYNETKGSFAAFAKVCVVNKMKNAVISSVGAAKGTTELDDQFSFDEIEDTKLGTEELVILREQNDEIIKRIDSLLSAHEKEAFNLYLDSYSYAQISKKLGVSVKSVDNAIARAKHKLRNYFINKP